MRASIVSGLLGFIGMTTAALGQVDRYSAGFYYDKVLRMQDLERGGSEDERKAFEAEKRSHDREKAGHESFVHGFALGYVEGQRIFSDFRCTDQPKLHPERIEELLQARILRLKHEEKENWKKYSTLCLITKIVDACGGTNELVDAPCGSQIDNVSAEVYDQNVMMPSRVESSRGNEKEKGPNEDKQREPEKEKVQRGGEKEKGAQDDRAHYQDIVRAYVWGYVEGRRAPKEAICDVSTVARDRLRIDELLAAKILQLKNEKMGWANYRYVCLITELVNACGKHTQIIDRCRKP